MVEITGTEYLCQLFTTAPPELRTGLRICRHAAIAQLVQPLKPNVLAPPFQPSVRSLRQFTRTESKIDGFDATLELGRSLGT